MGNRANFNVTGGNISIKNFIQNEGGPTSLIEGTQNQVTNPISHAAIDARYEIDKNRLAQLGREQQRAISEIDAALTQLNELRNEIKQSNETVDGGSGVLEKVRQTASWAYPIVKDFAGAVWPALAAALGVG
jgi:hypothetical protein